MTLLERLEEIAELTDIDHDICDTAREAIEEILLFSDLSFEPAFAKPK